MHEKIPTSLSRFNDLDRLRHDGARNQAPGGRDDRGNALGSGMYLVRMEAENFVSMRKDLLII
jgi:hypothetical protein